MDTLEKKLQEIRDLIKKIGELPQLPSIDKPKIQPSPQVETIKAPKAPGVAPQSKKDPAKIAQQLKDPNLSTKTIKQVKEQVKLSKNGQWSLEKVFPVPSSP